MQLKDVLKKYNKYLGFYEGLSVYLNLGNKNIAKAKNKNILKKISELTNLKFVEPSYLFVDWMNEYLGDIKMKDLDVFINGLIIKQNM